MVNLQVVIGAFCLNFVTGIVIKIPDGKIEGIEDTTRNGIKYHSFLAVPFAEPPIGPLRLQSPEPVKPWKGIFNATVEKNICYQVYGNSPKENEDCLYLNVFTPKDLGKCLIRADLTVMVWIHAGGFMSGSSYIKEGGVGPKFFMDKNVVLVSVNYRIGPLGFSSTGDEVLPGNLGLKDLVLGLKWVQNNIARFGGDPKKVTIFGQSAGAAACSFLLLSPLSKGLFRAAIMESGAAITPWAYQRNQRNITLLLAQKIDPNFKSTNSSDVLALLQSVSAASIDSASAALYGQWESPANFQLSQGFIYAPVIEVPHKKAFLTKRMYGLFENGDYIKVPVFTGMVDEEALILLANGERTLTGLWKAYDSNPEYLVPLNLHITDENLRKLIGVELKEKYAGKEGFATDPAKGIKFHTMQDFDKSHIKQAELMAKHSKVYFYEFSYKGKMGNYFYSVPGTGNVSHAEEVNYFLSKSYSSKIPDNTDMSYFSESDQNVHHRVMSLWTNFAKYLNPTPRGIDRAILQHVTWKPVTPNKFNYLEIGENLNMKTGYPKNDSYIYWNKIYEKYAVLPLDTF